MKSDIILDDYSIEVVGHEVVFKNQGLRMKRGKITLGEKNDDGGKSIAVMSKNGNSNISPHYISSKKIVTNKVETKDVLIGLSPGDRPKPGKIEVINKQGDAVITIDGEKEDIIIKGIGGSLINKIKDLEGSSGNNSTGAVGGSNIDGSLQFKNGRQPMIYIFESGTNNPDRSIISHSEVYKNWGLLYRDKGDKMIFQASGSSVLTADLGSKKVGIGTDDPDYTLHVEGEIRGRGAYNSLSDVRCKQNIDDLPNSIDKIMRLRGVSFNWKENNFTGKNPPKEKQIGFVAQEVEKVLPEAVSKDKSGLASMTYSSIIPLLVESIKEQQKTIKMQENTINSQNVKFENLSKKMDNLEAKLKGLTE